MVILTSFPSSLFSSPYSKLSFAFFSISGSPNNLACPAGSMRHNARLRMSFSHSGMASGLEAPESQTASWCWEPPTGPR